LKINKLNALTEHNGMDMLKAVSFIFTCRDTDSDYWALDGKGAVAGSTYHRGPRSSCKWRRAPEDEVTTLF
jgi:hypothetical protein